MYDINIEERKYINLKDSKITVSFQLTGSDWSKLSQSSNWKDLENFLYDKKIADAQMCRIFGK